MATTESPLSNMTIKEKIEFVRKQYGDEAADKVAQDEIKKKVLESPEILLPEDIINKTDHLPNYDLVEQAISLQGEEYKMISKEIYKMLVSLACPENLRIIRVGEIETDLRVAPNINLSSGKGKKNIGEAVKRIYKLFNPEANIKEPRTIHYQHLIGKMLLRKEKIQIGETKTGTPKYKTTETWIPKYGFLNSDILILEEAYELFNSHEKNDVDCRDAITVALDCYGKNLIMKQNMDNLDTKEETLSYNPYVSILSFSQPLMFQETYVTKGLSRRLHTCYKNFPERTKLDKYVNRLTSKVDDEKSCIEFVAFMKKINSIRTKWKLSSDAVETFTICHAALLEQGFRQGGKVAHYTRILEFPMQNLLLKMSAIQALTNLRTNITKEDIRMAFVDILERLTHEFIFVEKKIKGTLDYGESWGGATGKTQECLEVLYEMGAVSKESSVNIWTFQRVISRIFDISDRRAKDRYKSMKQDKLISDFLGQGRINGVWMNFEPKIRTSEESDDDERLNPKRLYFDISGMTEKSGMTPKTGIPLIIKTDISNSIDNTEDKHTPNNNPKSNENSSSTSLTPNNTSYSVIPDIPDTAHTQSDRDTQYYEDLICKNIKSDITKKQLKSYIKKNPKSTIEQLINKFGPGVMKFKKEGLI